VYFRSRDIVSSTTTLRSFSCAIKTAKLTDFFSTNSLCICSILRLVYVIDVFYRTWDMTWASQPAYMWLALEAELAVICASAPALKIYFKDNLSGTTAAYPGRSTYVKKGSNGTGADALEGGTVVAKKQGLWDVSVDDEHEHEEFSAGEKAGTFLHSANYSHP
jgi:hypothetical protein